MRGLRSCSLGLLVGIACVSAATARAEDVREPKLVTLLDAQVKEGTAARASRNYAWMGYNTPEINLQLPPVDNSAYAEVTFAPAKLLDKAGKPVAYEVENGLYGSDTHAIDVRFTPKDAKPDSPPVEFAKAVGTIKVRYPVVARTVLIKPAVPVTVGGAKLSVKGKALVVDSPPGWKMLEAPFGAGLDEPLRVYDAAGKRLEEDRSQQETDMSGPVTHTTRVFKGTIAQVKLDAVDEWAEVELPYDLPPAPKLPAGDAGTKPANAGISGAAVHPTVVRRLPK